MSPLSSVLLVAASLSLWSPAVGFRLPRCQLVNQTVSLEKKGCPRCHTVETTICSGHCPTKDPVLKDDDPFKPHQNVCTYREFSYRYVELPDCPLDVDPVVRYPVALSCYCGRCSMDTSDCTFERLKANVCEDNIYY